MFAYLDIETSSECNRKCPYCPVSTGNREGVRKFMPEQTFTAIVSELAANSYTGVVNLNLYNEPMLDPRLPGFIRLLSREVPGCRPHLYTNGDYLRAGTIQELFEAGLYSMKITDHNPTPNTRLISLVAGTPYRVTLARFAQGKDILHNRGGALNNEWTQGKAVCWTKAGNRCYVNYEGKVLGCCDDYFAAEPFGQVPGQKLMDIWNGSSFTAFRDGLKVGQHALKVCEGCNAR